MKVLSSFLASGLMAALLVGDMMYAEEPNLERHKVEQPRYTVVKATPDYEVRDYRGCIVAEVTLSGDADSAMSRGFGPLADFIFGNNTSDGKVEMTSPVTQQPSSKKIPMTSPVTQQPKESEDTEQQQVRFIMPSDYTMETLPTPKNEKVSIKELPPVRVAATRFSGFGSHAVMLEKEAALREALKRDGLTVVGAPTYAKYDPPWTLPGSRRNEVWLPIELESPNSD